MRVAAAICVSIAILAGAAIAPGQAAAGPFDGRGMWMWYVSRSAGGRLSTIASQLRLFGIKTVFVKSGDGATYWSQFSPTLVRSLHAARVRTCAWQYVYGGAPVSEADVGIRAVRNGADCLVIDAEAEYQGRYASAQTYLSVLRAGIGRRFPVGLASYPYVDYHPGFPYSVFLGRGGAQFDLPQMYWRDIGTSVSAVYRHTYLVNRIYRRPIRPLGQTYNGATAGEIALFRGLSVSYRAGGLSWWDFAWTSARGLWPALSGPYSPARHAPVGFPLLHVGSAGDMVVWLQELLADAYRSQRVTGRFAGQTLANLRAFQRRRGIPATGETGPLTWRALLRLRAVRVRWATASAAAGGPHGSSTSAPGRSGAPGRDSGSGGSGALDGPTDAAPQSAPLRALAYEIHKPAADAAGAAQQPPTAARSVPGWSGHEAG